MGDYEQAQQVSAPAGRLFDYLSDVSNLPRYFTSMISAEPGAGESVRVSADVHGTPREGEAWLRVDSDKQHLEWGSEGPSNYHGSLDVKGDQTSSEVTVSLHTERVDSGEIEQGLRNTLSNIKRLVEDGPAPGPTDEPSPAA